MCTLSWVPETAGYHVFYNRDEQPTRAPGIGPRRRLRRGVPYLAPLDPESGGTWLAVNAHGITVCLLNRYRGNGGAPGRRSRGLIVNEVADLERIEALPDRLREESLTEVGHFTAAAFDGQAVKLVAWDGQELRIRDHAEPGLVEASSAADETIVAASRQRLFAAGPLGVERLRALHRSHHPERGPLSVCMHRDEAATVSFSQVTVTEDAVMFRYVDGSPCRGSREESVRLSRAPLSVG